MISVRSAPPLLMLIRDAHIAHALARSGYRGGTLLALRQVDGATLSMLGQMVGLRASRMAGVLVGNRSEYKERDSLVALRLVRRFPSPVGWIYALTDEGRGIADELARSLLGPAAFSPAVA